MDRRQVEIFQIRIRTLSSNVFFHSSRTTSPTLYKHPRRHHICAIMKASVLCSPVFTTWVVASRVKCDQDRPSMTSSNDLEWRFDGAQLQETHLKSRLRIHAVTVPPVVLFVRLICELPVKSQLCLRYRSYRNGSVKHAGRCMPLIHYCKVERLLSDSVGVTASNRAPSCCCCDFKQCSLFFNQEPLIQCLHPQTTAGATPAQLRWTLTCGPPGLRLPLLQLHQPRHRRPLLHHILI